jgi:hypothetical protein
VTALYPNWSTFQASSSAAWRSTVSWWSWMTTSGPGFDLVEQRPHPQPRLAAHPVLPDLAGLLPDGGLRRAARPLTGRRAICGTTICSSNDETLMHVRLLAVQSPRST